MILQTHKNFITNHKNCPTVIWYQSVTVDCSIIVHIYSPVFNKNTSDVKGLDTFEGIEL